MNNQPNKKTKLPNKEMEMIENHIEITITITIEVVTDKTEEVTTVIKVVKKEEETITSDKTIPRKLALKLIWKMIHYSQN